MSRLSRLSPMRSTEAHFHSARLTSKPRLEVSYASFPRNIRRELRRTSESHPSDIRFRYIGHRPCVNPAWIVRLTVRRQCLARGLRSTLYGARSASGLVSKISRWSNVTRRIILTVSPMWDKHSAILAEAPHSPTGIGTYSTVKLFARANKSSTPIMAKSPCSECPQVRGKRSMGDLTRHSQREKWRTANTGALCATPGGAGDRGFDFSCANLGLDEHELDSIWFLGI